MNKSEKLPVGLKKLGFSQEIYESLSVKMEVYIKELILFNSAYNLVNTDNPEEIAVRHILDSLSAFNEIKNLINEEKLCSPRIADVGSGGGLPGIPLAAAFPDYNFTLIERMDKRCSFLENEAAILSLENVNVLKSEAEKIKPESFDIAVFRAFRPLDKKMIKTLLSMIKKGGYLVAFKAKKESVLSEMEGIKDIIKNYSIVSLYVPFLTDGDNDKENRERNLVLIKKE